MANKSEWDDEFFGDLLDDSENIAGRNGIGPCFDDYSGFETAEAAAMGKQYRTLGFHEAFEEHKDTLLQEGFESGFRENFDIAQRIGQTLGEIMTRAISNKSADQDQGLQNQAISKLIRDGITRSNPVPLSELERHVHKTIIDKRNNDDNE